MAGKMFVPVEIELIDEGKFLNNVSEALKKVQMELLQHVKQYGHKAKGSKASVKMEIMFACLDPDNDGYGCAVDISMSLPKTPKSVSLLMSGETQTGEPCLLCRASGSDEDDPKQLKLCTVDGKLVNQSTGEVIE